MTTPEFGFNGYMVEGKPKPVRSALRPINKEALRTVLQLVHAEIKKPEYNEITIICSLSAVTYEVDEATGSQRLNEEGKVVGENCQRLITNKSERMHEVHKWEKHSADGWPPNYAVNELRFLEPNPNGVKERVMKLENFPMEGASMLIGIGTCADTYKQTYPNCHIALLAGGGMFRSAMLDGNLPGYLFNDAQVWNTTDGQDRPSFRSAHNLVNLADLPEGQDIIRAAHDGNMVLIQECLKMIKFADKKDPRVEVARDTLSLFYENGFTLPERLVDYDCSPRSEIVGEARVTPTTPLPDQFFEFTDAVGTKSRLPLVDIAQFKDIKEYSEMKNITEKQAKREGLKMDVFSVRKMIDLYANAEEQANRDGKPFHAVPWGRDAVVRVDLVEGRRGRGRGGRGGRGRGGDGPPDRGGGGDGRPVDHGDRHGDRGDGEHGRAGGGHGRGGAGGRL